VEGFLGDSIIHSSLIGDDQIIGIGDRAIGLLEELEKYITKLKEEKEK